MSLNAPELQQPNYRTQIVARLGGQQNLVDILRSNVTGGAAILSKVFDFKKDEWSKVSTPLTRALTISPTAHTLSVPLSFYCLTHARIEQRHSLHISSTDCPSQIAGRLGGQQSLVDILRIKVQGSTRLLNKVLTISDDDWTKVSILMTRALAISPTTRALSAPLSFY